MKTCYRIFVLGALFFFSSQIASAQTFTRGVDLFSKKKTSYLTLASGEEIEGNIKKIIRKKGNIKSINITLPDGSVGEYTPDQIQNAFLPRSGFEKFVNSIDDAYNVTTWEEDSPEGERIKDGYAYMQTEEVLVKKKKMMLLMQVVNPHFNKAITVYHDPMARETASVGVGGFTVAGGIDKSYYIKKNGDDTVVRLKKKDYDEEYEGFFGDCDIKPEDSRRIKWSDFAEHVFIYTTKCAE